MEKLADGRSYKRRQAYLLSDPFECLNPIAWIFFWPPLFPTFLLIFVASVVVEFRVTQMFVVRVSFMSMLQLVSRPCRVSYLSTVHEVVESDTHIQYMA